MYKQILDILGIKLHWWQKLQLWMLSQSWDRYERQNQFSWNAYEALLPYILNGDIIQCGSCSKAYDDADLLKYLKSGKCPHCKSKIYYVTITENIGDTYD